MSQDTGASQEPAAGGTDVSPCFVALAGFQTLHHMEAVGKAALFDFPLAFSSVICHLYCHRIYNMSLPLLK